MPGIHANSAVKSALAKPFTRQLTGFFSGLTSQRYALVLGLALTALNALPSAAAVTDLLRTVPLEITGYEAGKQFPAHFTDAASVLSAINSSPVLLLHMEALRRASLDLTDIEKKKVTATLLKKHQVLETDLALGFDLGYAQLVLDNNKTGLFFLRKANDKLKTQFTALAYGMAEAQADLTLENAKPEETTTRKMDSTYQLSDAVMLDAASHQPGFWPSFIKVIADMKTVSAYGSFSRRDFSRVYVPIGKNGTLIPPTTTTKPGETTVTLPLSTDPATLLNNSANTSCNPADSDDVDLKKEGKANPLSGGVVAQRTATFGGNTASLQFFPIEGTHFYRVRILSTKGEVLLSFKTHAMPSIVEDLDGDGSLEIVARQYEYDPTDPILVYRYTPCGFELDKKIFNDFR